VGLPRPAGFEASTYEARLARFAATLSTVVELAGVRSAESGTDFGTRGPFGAGLSVAPVIIELAMPTISRFFGITIAMYFDDHGYPHFHARAAGGEAKVRTDNLEVMDSTLGRRQLRLVLAWAEIHQDELRENWRRARADTPRDRAIAMTGLTPDITAASVVRHGVLGLTFADGVRGEVDVLDRMRGPVFVEARTPEGFARVTVDTETGTVVWPGGADLAPDTLYERVRSGSWPDRDVAA
jgi:hypothetical protein